MFYFPDEIFLTFCVTRLGCPGLWWRVTAISLVLSGKAPREIGAEMWMEHPTLRALMKMTVSRKFLFPTVDCDNESRAKMKMDDIDMADQVRSVALSPRIKILSFCSEFV